MLIKGVNLPRQKKIYTEFFHLFIPFKCLCAPTFWSPMSKHLRYSKFLGKSNGKKWSQIVKLLLIKGVKYPCKKNVFFFGKFGLTSRIFLVLMLQSALVERLFVSCMRDLKKNVIPSAIALVLSIHEKVFNCTKFC